MFLLPRLGGTQSLKVFGANQLSYKLGSKEAISVPYTNVSNTEVVTQPHRAGISIQSDTSLAADCLEKVSHQTTKSEDVELQRQTDPH
jgi:hypothetical protein